MPLASTAPRLGFSTDLTRRFITAVNKITVLPVGGKVVRGEAHLELAEIVLEKLLEFSKDMAGLQRGFNQFLWYCPIGIS